MVNLDKWEEISFENINKGDKIKVIITGDKENVQTKTVTTATVDTLSWESWYADSVRVANKPENKAAGFTETVYRRKPKPFEFPTKKLAIVKAERIGHEGVFACFVNTSSGWYHQTGSTYTHNEMLKWFHNFENCFAGISE